MRPRRIELYMPELVLEGVDPGDRERVIASLERELTRHLARGEHPRASMSSVIAEQPTVLGPEDLGAHVARAIAKGGER